MLNRRALLRGLGRAGLALPGLQMFSNPNLASAQADGKRAKNLVIIYSPNGIHPSAFWPSEGERDLTSSPILAPFEAHRERLLLVRGLKFPVRPPQHQPQVATTGDPVTASRGSQTGDGLTSRTKHPSLDQYVAAKLSPPTRFRSLELGIYPVGGDTPSSINFGMDGAPLPRMTDPKALWTRMFEGIAAPVSDPAAGDVDVDVAKARRRAVSDFVAQGFAALRPKLGREDRARLERHLESIKDTESRLLGDGTAPISASCAAPQVALKPTGGAAYSDVPALSDNFQNLIGLALSCSLTRVVSLSMGYPGGGGAGGLRAPWLGISNAHHKLSHHKGNAGQIDLYIKLSTWIAGQVAGLATRLAQIPRAEGGSVLDDTIIYWFNRHGDGNAHANTDIPCVIVGGAGGAFGRMGRYVQTPGTTHASILISLAHAMGVETPAFGVGGTRATAPVPGLVS